MNILQKIKSWFSKPKVQDVPIGTSGSGFYLKFYVVDGKIHVDSKWFDPYVMAELVYRVTLGNLFDKTLTDVKAGYTGELPNGHDVFLDDLSVLLNAAKASYTKKSDSLDDEVVLVKPSDVFSKGVQP